MGKYLPPKPSVSSGQHSGFHMFCEAVWDAIFGGRFPFVDTDTVKVSRSPSGYAFNAVVIGGGGTGGGQESDFAGVYVPGQIYNSFQTVVVQGNGLGSGEYISLVDGNVNSPLTGVNWIQLSALTQWF